MLIGLISDTHGLVRPEIAGVFAGVDLIVHAGDVGGHAVLEALRTIAPVEAVYGNVDDAADLELARERTIPVDGLILHVSHGHELGRPTPELVLARYDGDILVFGHTHRAVIWHGERDATAPRRTRRTIVNPGAAGPRRFEVQPSVARLRIGRGRADVEIVPL